MNKMLEQLGIRAKDAESSMRLLSTDKKIRCCARSKSLTQTMHKAFLTPTPLISPAAKKNNMSQGLLDRLLLTKERIEGMADGLLQLVD